MTRQKLLRSLVFSGFIHASFCMDLEKNLSNSEADNSIEEFYEAPDLKESLVNKPTQFAQGFKRVRDFEENRDMTDYMSMLPQELLSYILCCGVKSSLSWAENKSEITNSLHSLLTLSVLSKQCFKAITGYNYAESKRWSLGERASNLSAVKYYGIGTDDIRSNNHAGRKFAKNHLLNHFWLGTKTRSIPSFILEAIAHLDASDMDRTTNYKYINQGFGQLAKNLTNTNVRTVDISCNTGSQAIEFLNNISSESKIEFVDISTKNLTCSDLSSLEPSVLNKNKIQLRMGILKQNTLSLLINLSHQDTLQLAFVNDHGLEFLSNFINLKTLRLFGCNQITDDGFTHLGALSMLQTLELKDCDNVSGKAILHFSKLPMLKNLRVSGKTKITRSELRKFNQK